MINSRYTAYPQMQNYEVMKSGEPTQYSMLSGPKNYESATINTDKNGFRNSFFNKSIINTENASQQKYLNVILGGSTVFGVGADDDSTTLPSYLAELTNEPWLNLGVRGCNSFQEIIYLIQNLSSLNQIKHLIFFSGVNDTFINILRPEDAGYDRQVNEIPLYLNRSKKRITLAYLLASLKNVNPENLIDLSLKEMLFYKEHRPSNEKEFHFNFDLLQKNTYRNFNTYLAFKNICSGQLHFFLQPLFPWTNKKISEKETAAFQDLENLQKNSDWAQIKPIISANENFQKVKSIFNQAANQYTISFLDTNSYFNSSESYFVDNVHLTSQGYLLAAKLIAQKLNS